MKFEELFALVVEGKGTKPGERFNRVKNAEGPSGVTASPIGRDDYNPEIFVPNKTDPKDTGMSDEVSIIKLLGKSFQLLKNDDTFQDQMKGIMNGFKRNRNQISHYQESVIKSKPKTIDNLWGRYNTLLKIVHDPKKREDKDHGKFVSELEKVKNTLDGHQAELDQVYSEIENVVGENEELNQEYLDQLLTVIKHTANRLYKKHSAELTDVNTNKAMVTIPLNELDFDKLEKGVGKDMETQLRLLEMLASEDPSSNPLLTFLEIQEGRYEDAKNLYFQVKRGDNYSVSVEQLYRNLPLFSIVNYFSHVILKSPAISLTNKQSKRLKAGERGDSMMDKLSNIKSEREFEELKPSLLDYIDLQSIGDSEKNMLVGIANGKFQPVKNRPNAAFKIRSSLKSMNITESFDQWSSSFLKSLNWDENEFKLNQMEIRK